MQRAANTLGLPGLASLLSMLFSCGECIRVYRALAARALSAADKSRTKHAFAPGTWVARGEGSSSSMLVTFSIGAGDPLRPQTFTAPMVRGKFA